MIVHDLDRVGTIGRPDETDPILIVNPDAMLTGMILDLAKHNTKTPISESAAIFTGTHLPSLPGWADDRAIGIDLLPKDAKLLRRRGQKLFKLWRDEGGVNSISLMASSILRPRGKDHRFGLVIESVQDRALFERFAIGLQRLMANP